MRVKFRLLKASGYAALALALAALTGAFASGAAVTAAPAAYLVPLGGSVAPATDPIVGGYSSRNMKIEVAIAPRNEAAMNSLLTALYNPNSKLYHDWLKTGQFDADYAPLPSTRTAIATFLGGKGLKVLPSSSPFLVVASGSSTLVSDAFHTTLNTFKDPRGIKYFANSTPVWMPSNLVGDTLGVIGLTNTVVPIQRTQTFKPIKGIQPPFGDRFVRGSSSCETKYVTKQELFNYINNGTSFPYGYGGGPDCSGLTPSQTNSLYSAPKLGPRAEGEGVTLAVFELSAYLTSDIDTWAHQFYGPGYTPNLVNINVDGGPLAPAGPCLTTTDACIPPTEGYFGDVEVNADIEQQLALSPDASAIEVYEAPADDTGQTELDAYTQLANDNTAASVSSSWGYCEDDLAPDPAFVEAENIVFKQMAMQAQSMFASSGDTGAFECIRSDETDQVVGTDPASQPYVTAVGGTTFDVDNPGTNPHPHYPALLESVWNVDNLCSEQGPNPGNDNLGGYFWCGATGAGGGGSSIFWGAPSWQTGPGVVNPYSTYGNGTTQCSLAKVGTLCRETPDVSANADEYTPYAEYCTAPTPADGAECTGSLSGWFGIGGTSLSSPLWSGIIADRDSWQGKRTGNAAAFLYGLFNSYLSSLYFHDITTFGPLTGNYQIPTNNGLFPETAGYDEATGIGTPIMSALITGL